MRTKGSYILLISLEEVACIQVGKLGLFTFPKGYYLYTGSALGGIEARIARHLWQDKRLHWHIDYLLGTATVEEVWVTYQADRLECRLARICRELAGAGIPVKGFGSSDCHCPAHLVHLPHKPEIQAMQAVAGSAIVLTPLPIPGRD